LPTVNAGPDANVCNTPNPYTLTGFSPTGGTWSGTGVTSGGVFTPSGVGTVTLTYTVTQNGCTATDQVVLNVINPVSANAGEDQAVCLESGSSVQLNGAPLGGSWSGTVQISPDGLFIPAEVGVFQFIYSIDLFECSLVDTVEITVLSCLSDLTPNTEMDLIAAYFDAWNGILNVQCMSCLDKNFTLEIYNLLGSCLINKSNMEFGSITWQEDLRHLPTGIYWAKISTLSGTRALKFFKP
jgi:hypothetical protein